MDERERRHAIDVTVSQLDKRFRKGAVRGRGGGLRDLRRGDW